MHPASHRQFEVLEKAAGITVRRANAGRYNEEGLVTQVECDLNESNTSSVLFSGDGGNSVETARKIDAAISRFAEAINKARKPGGWFATGGETARTLCRSLNGASLELQHSIATGTMVAVLTDSNNDRCWMVTKPGGFGTEDLLPKVLDWWHASDNQRR
jgi:uncharacterized protein YgbK (DUF1537 family)